MGDSLFCHLSIHQVCTSEFSLATDHLAEWVGGLVAAVQLVMIVDVILVVFCFQNIFLIQTLIMELAK